LHVAGQDLSRQEVAELKRITKMIRKSLLAVLFLALCSITALAADFNGKWTADFTTPRGAQTLNFDLHVDGANLTGKISSARGDSDITEGKIDGDNISFVQVANFNGNAMKITYNGKIKGDEIDLSRQSGDRPAMDIVLKRVK
jgi:hypothetical protein